MQCGARCQCFLCRELQSCRAADSRRPRDKRAMCDNFILRKADAWEPIKFIRGAARLSVRHWQGREGAARAHRSTSCEQLCAPARDDPPLRAPAADAAGPDRDRPLLAKLLGNSRPKKCADRESKIRSVLNFRKSDAPDSGNVHEKYIPLGAGRSAERRAPPSYRSDDDDRDDGKPSCDRPPCYDEPTRRLAQENDRKAKVSREGGLADKITRNNNKVVIYFGDSIIRQHNERKKEVPGPEAVYVNGRSEEAEEEDALGAQGAAAAEAIYAEIGGEEAREAVAVDDATYKKEAAVGSDGFLVVSFEENYECARRLVDLVGGSERREATVLDDDHCDWSFIQGWRKRPTGGCRSAEDGGWSARGLRPPAHARPRSPPPHAHRTTTPQPLAPLPSAGCAEEDGVPGEREAYGEEGSVAPQPRPLHEHRHRPLGSDRLQAIPRSLDREKSNLWEVESEIARQWDFGRNGSVCDRQTCAASQNAGGPCHSSSDENRSSGHASMSDSGGADRDHPRRKQPHARAKHHKHGKAPWAGGGALEDIRCAIKQLTLRSRDSCSTASGSRSTPAEGDPRRRRAPLVRQPSLDTVCTNVTSADEFVWLDSHNRLVEPGRVPWSTAEVSRALSSGRCRDLFPRLAPDAPPRLSYLLQRALVRVAREAQRLSQNLGFCSKHEVGGAFRIVLSAALADACIKGCQRAATMYATLGGAARRQGAAARARTTLAPGRFQRWMLDVRLAPFVHEYAAVYLCAGIETLLEEVALAAGAGAGAVTAAAVDRAVAASADLRGPLQPYSHLNAGRIATGAPSASRCESPSSLASSASGAARAHDSGVTTDGSGAHPAFGASVVREPADDRSATCADGSGGAVWLSTCAGSAAELRAALRRLRPAAPPLTAAAERALFYYMRCEQLEAGGGGRCAGLWGARGAGALPPLGEWVRVARAHAALRAPPSPVDADDVQQAARLLLPHADCPPRPLAAEEGAERWCAREEPVDALDAAGLTALMRAAAAGDEDTLAKLLEAGADLEVETGGARAAHCAGTPAARAHHYTPPTAGWTALVYACGAQAVGCARRLLAAGARADGAPAKGDHVCTLTPLQMACGVGNLELVELLLSHGADPFLSTQLNDALCYSAAAQYGCYSAVAVCCAHGRRACLRAAMRGGARGSRGAALSLQEVLAEGAPAAAEARAPFSPQQQRALQDALYCAAETDHLDMSLELRAVGVPWSLHAWTLSLASAVEAGLAPVVDLLLRDFRQACPSDDGHYTKQFIYECLPLLFNILRHSKKESTVLSAAGIVSAVFGVEGVRGVSPAPPPAPPRIDVSYVNNPSLADVTFRVEGRLFYAHKIVLVSESPRLRAMLAPREGAAAAPAPPLVQIDDIRYRIFEQVMRYLYSGSCAGLGADEGEVLELLAAAAFFQLLPLQRHCEARAADALTPHNVVSVYIHAKVYGATQLLECCQGFLLQNLVALLQQEEAVKRLLLGARLPAHDALAGLLHALQARLEARAAGAKR